MLKRIAAVFLLIFVVVSIAPAVIAVQGDVDPERKRAFELFNDAQAAQALPLFEKLVVRYPEDPSVIEAYGMLVVWQSASFQDAAKRKQERKRGREILLKAQNLGANSVLLKTMIESVPPDGGADETFSMKKEVDEAMREGEAAFAKG